MPIKQSAKKYLRQTITRTARNTTRVSNLEYSIKQVLKSISAKQLDEAKTWLRTAQQQLDKAAQKGIVKKNTASRRMSRLQTRLHLAQKA